MDFDGSSDVTLKQMGAEEEGTAEKYTDSKLGSLDDVNIDDSANKGTFVKIINYLINLIKTHTHSYLPLSGGKVTGNISINRTDTADAQIKLKTNNATCTAALGTNSSGQTYVYDGYHDINMIITDTDGNTHIQAKRIIALDAPTTLVGDATVRDGALYCTSSTTNDPQVILVNKNSDRAQFGCSVNNKGVYIYNSAYKNTAFYTDNVGNTHLSGVGAVIMDKATHVSADLYTVGSVHINGGSGWVHGTGVYTDVKDANIHLRASNGGYAVTGGTKLDVLSADYKSFVYVEALSFNTMSSKLVKENVKNIDDEDAKNLLNLNPITFDYKKNFGGQTGNVGLIAEEVLPYFPAVVNVPKDYDESKFDESKGINQEILNIDYSKFVPYLIKMIQIQEKRINELEDRVITLENSLVKEE